MGHVKGTYLSRTPKGEPSAEKGNFIETKISKKYINPGISVKAEEKINTLKTGERKTSDISRDENELYLDLISHDINNKNAVAILNSQLLVEDLTLNEMQRDRIGRILNSAQASSKILENIKKFRQLEQVDLEEYSIYLDDLLNDVIKEYSNMS